MMRYSIDLSAFPFAICAFVSSPLFVTIGSATRFATGAGCLSHGQGPSAGPVHDLPGAAAGLAGSAGAGAGAVNDPSVGAMKVSVAW